MNMQNSEVYVGLGGNVGDSISIVKESLQQIQALTQVKNFQVSHFYRTQPESDIPQNEYVNAVCRFDTSFNAKELLAALQKIENSLGKIPKPKNAPRIIDLDILFFGKERWNESDLEIPHPRWKQRLFVLTPLADLVTHIDDGRCAIDIHQLIRSFPSAHRKQVQILSC